MTPSNRKAVGDSGLAAADARTGTGPSAPLFTPGPLAVWGVQTKTEIGGFYMIGRANEIGGCTAYVDGPHNAALYVAAPEMYEALKAAQSYLDSVEGQGEGGTSAFDVPSGLVQFAIARAEGRS
jgi:hypothetical protein